MTREAMDRLSGVSIYSVEGADCVMVNMTAVNAEFEDWIDARIGEGVEPTEEEMRAAVAAISDDPAYWVRSEPDPRDETTEYSYFPINTETGHLLATED